MSKPFARSFQSLETEARRVTPLAILAAVALVAAWAVWFFAARISLHAVSSAARIEVDRALYPLQVPVSGRVVTSNLTLGRAVVEGETLLEIDATPERERLAEEKGALQAAQTARSALARELAAAEDAFQAARRTEQLGVTEAQARRRAMEAGAQLAADEHSRVDRLRSEGLVSEIDSRRAHVAAEQRGAEVDALAASIDKLVSEQSRSRHEHAARIAALSRESAGLDSDIAVRSAAVARLEYVVDRFRLRAPVDGRLSEVADLRPSALVSERDTVATLVAPGTLSVVAHFTPAEAFGRIQTGQRGTLRLAGFPWTQYGSVPLIVTRMASEVRDGAVRVDLSVEAGSMAAIPVQHGLPGTVDVVVDRVSPAWMLLRVAGERLPRSLSGDSVASARVP